MSTLPSSFRDPSGFVFQYENRIYRQVNNVYAQSYEKFMICGLYEELTARKILIEHTEISDGALPRTDECHKILEPDQLRYISYPYEWSFSQLKDAALLTLRAQAIALKHGFTLKDASAYNIQFHHGRPVFIDTLSFEPYEEGKPWTAYRQFCQHFAAPLALMARTDIELGKMLSSHIDGIPLPLASRLLPARTWLSYPFLAHIHLHAKMQAGYADLAGENQSSSQDKASSSKVSAKGLRAIAESLASFVNKLDWTPPKTEWGDYYDHTNYNDEASQKKRELVDEFLSRIDSPLNIVQDLGANTGEFSRIATKHADLVVSQDIDPVAVEKNYRKSREDKDSKLLPLRQDLFSPSPAIGWANEERESFRERAGCDAMLALALIHHLAISNNLPLAHIANLFAALSKWLIIEFVPKSDSQVIRLLETREDIFDHYNIEDFERVFGEYFDLREKQTVHGSERTLFLFQRK